MHSRLMCCWYRTMAAKPLQPKGSLTLCVRVGRCFNTVTSTDMVILHPRWCNAMLSEVYACCTHPLAAPCIGAVINHNRCCVKGIWISVIGACDPVDQKCQPFLPEAIKLSKGISQNCDHSTNSSLNLDQGPCIFLNAGLVSINSVMNCWLAL